MRNIGYIHLKLVIFDCDGVLIDSEIISAHALAAELKRLGLPIDLDFVLANFLGRSFPTVVAELRDRFGTQLEDGFEQIYRARLIGEFENRLEVMPGVQDLLEKLVVQSCVATSSSPARVRRSLEIVGLDSFFRERVFTASAVENGKPAPDLFLHVAEKMGCDPTDCLVIEDSIPGVQAALAAGMAVWHFAGGSHLAGTAFRLPDDVKPHRVFDSFDDFYDVAPELRRTVSNGIPG